MEAETLPQLAERIKKMHDEKLKQDAADLAAWLKDRSIEIVPIIQLPTKGGDAIFEIGKMINGTSGYMLRYTE